MSDEMNPVGRVLRFRIAKLDGSVMSLPFLCTAFEDGKVTGIAFHGKPMQAGWHKGTMEFSDLEFGDDVRNVAWPDVPAPAPAPVDDGKVAALEAKVAKLEADLKALATASPAPVPTPTPAPTKRAPARKRSAKASGKS